MAWQPKHFKPGDAPPTTTGGIIIVYGWPGVGKSQFVLNSGDVASPLWYANFDRSAAHLIKNYKGEGGVHYADFTALTKDKAKEQCEQLMQMRNGAMNQGTGVFALDNFAAASDLVLMAYYDHNKSGALAYGPVNNFWRDFVLGLESAGIWCLITAPPKEIWRSVLNKNTGNMTGQATGLYDPEGWKHLEFHAMAEIWLYTNRPAGAQAIPVGTGAKLIDGVEFSQREPLAFKGQIQIAKKRPGVEGVILTNPSLKLMLKVLKELPADA
jgi:hypothetical protein